MARKILVIDDEPDLLKVIKVRLEKSGYKVVGGACGQEAIDLARQEKPDVVVLDIYLPDINGDKVTKIFKKDERLKNIPVILISATARSVAQEAQECGAEGCLTKPFEPQDMINMIEKFLKYRLESQEARRYS